MGKPSTEVTNYNSIGIEVVGMYDSKSKTWECLTPEQIESTSQTLAAILIEYNLSIMDIYPHEDVSAKTAGEGGTVQEAVMERTKELVNPIIKLERKEIKLPPVALSAKATHYCIQPTKFIGTQMRDFCTCLIFYYRVVAHVRLSNCRQFDITYTGSRMKS